MNSNISAVPVDIDATLAFIEIVIKERIDWGLIFPGGNGAASVPANVRQVDECALYL